MVFSKTKISKWCTERLIFLRDLTLLTKKILSFVTGVAFPSSVIITCGILNGNTMTAVFLSGLVLAATGGTHFLSWKIVEQLIGDQKTDSLTGLYNEPGFITAFHERCAALAAEHRPARTNGERGTRNVSESDGGDELQSLIKITLAFIYMDLDRFKSLNDRFGHDVGDLFIKATADILRSAFRDLDLIARLHGDEFAIVVTNMTPEMLRERAEVTIASVRARLATYMEELGLKSSEREQVTATMGICFSHAIPASGKVRNRQLGGVFLTPRDPIHIRSDR